MSFSHLECVLTLIISYSTQCRIDCCPDLVAELVRVRRKQLNLIELFSFVLLRFNFNVLYKRPAINKAPLCSLLFSSIVHTVVSRLPDGLVSIVDDDLLLHRTTALLRVCNRSPFRRGVYLYL
jgi:hypothetical protein